MKGKKLVLSDEQMAWLVENFADTENAVIREALGCCETTLRVLARSLGLWKSEAHMEKRKDKARVGLRRYFLTHKANDNHEHLMPFCFKKGNDPRLFDGFWDGLARGHAKRNQTIREEKARIAFGLPQRTRMQLKRQPRPKIHQRHYLKTLGYIVDGNVAYYTPDTTRAMKLEEGKVKKVYFKFMPYEHQREQQGSAVAD